MKLSDSPVLFGSPLDGKVRQAKRRWELVYALGVVLAGFSTVVLFLAGVGFLPYVISFCIVVLIQVLVGRNNAYQFYCKHKNDEVICYRCSESIQSLNVRGVVSSRRLLNSARLCFDSVGEYSCYIMNNKYFLGGISNGSIEEGAVNESDSRTDSTGG